MHLPRRAVAVGVAALALLGGGGAAVAATQGDGDGRDAFLDSVAKHLGVSREELDDATKAAAKDQLAAAVEAGRLTQARADELAKRIDQGELPPLGGLGGRHGHGHGAGHALGLGLDAAASYLGLSAAQLRTQLRGGKSLADVAEAEGKSVSGLEDALAAAAREQLDGAVEDGRLTDAQRDEALERVSDHVDDLVQGELPRPWHRRGGRSGPSGGEPHPAPGP